MQSSLIINYDTKTHPFTSYSPPARLTLVSVILPSIMHSEHSPAVRHEPHTGSSTQLEQENRTDNSTVATVRTKLQADTPGFRRFVIINVIAVMSLTGAASVIALLFVLSATSDLQTLLNQHMKKSSLAVEMTVASGQRIAQLYELMTADDAFTRDTAIMSFYAASAIIDTARRGYDKLPLNQREQQLLAEIDNNTQRIVQHQNQLIDLRRNDKTQAARLVFDNFVIPINRAQNRRFNEINQLNTEAAGSASTLISTTVTDIVWISSGLWALALIIAAIVGRQINRGIRIHEQTLRQHRQDLTTAANEALYGEQTKSRFIATMSHEFRTPLNAIQGFAELLADEISVQNTPDINTPEANKPRKNKLEKNNLNKTTSKTQRYLQGIQQASNMMLVLINDILDSSQLTEGKLQLDLAEASLCNAFTEVIDLCLPLCTEKNNKIILKDHNTQNKTVLLDSCRFKQIVLNLVNNALKFTSNGCVCINTHLQINDSHTARLTVIIRDNGIGIPAAQLPKLFESFVQAHSGRNRQHGGTGLGLSICRELASLMDGHIEVESQQHTDDSTRSGSCFTLTLDQLPLVKTDEAPETLLSKSDHSMASATEPTPVIPRWTESLASEISHALKKLGPHSSINELEQFANWLFALAKQHGDDSRWASALQVHCQRFRHREARQWIETLRTSLNIPATHSITRHANTPRSKEA